MNLFIISGVSHLYHIQNIIMNYKFKGGPLIILKLEHTGETEDNINNIKMQIIPNLFSEVIVVPIKNVSHFYFDLLKKYQKFDHVFMTAYTGVFFDIAKDLKKRKSSLVLYEEGLSTYKLVWIKNQSLFEKALKIFRVSKFLKLKNPDQESTQTSEFGLTPKNNPRRETRTVFKQLISYGLTLFKKIRRKLQYEFFDGFDYSFVTYPDKISPVMRVKGAEKNYTLNFPMNEFVRCNLEKVIEQIPEDAVLFMSQPMYHTSLTEEEYVELTINTLEQFDEKNIIIKMHPRETIQKKKAFESKIKQKKKNYILIEGDKGLQFPSELLLTSNKIKRIVAFSSTTLIYAPKINDSIKTISLFNIINDYHNKKKGAKFIMREIRKELEKFPHIFFL